jgi:hypothetical protein
MRQVGLFFRSLGLGIECEALDHGIGAKLVTQPVDCLLGIGGTAIDEIGKIGAADLGECRDPDAYQAEPDPIGLENEQVASHAEDPGSELGGMPE